MQRYIVVRLFHALLALFAMSIIVFSLARISGNPMDVLLPEDATEQDFIQTAELWGLDKPLHVQYLVYLGNVLKGDFGVSIKWPGRSTRDLIFARLPATLQLSALSLVVAALLALPLGVLVAVKKDTGIDYAGKVVALLGQAAPSFWVGIILIWIFAVTLNWLPASGREGFTSLITPRLCPGLVPGSGGDAADPLFHAGGAGQRVRQAGPHQGNTRLESNLETLPAQRRHRAPDLFRLHPRRFPDRLCRDRNGVRLARRGVAGD